MPASISTCGLSDSHGGAHLAQGGFSELLYINTPVSNMQASPVSTQLPWLEITVQPKSKMRFRYMSEKGSHGMLTGEKSGKKVTYPSVKLHNYFGESPVYATASLYTNEENPILHVHTLQGNGCDNGTCTVQFNSDMEAVIEKVNITFCKTKTINDVVLSRKCKQMNGNKQSLKSEADEEAKRIRANTDAVKICFEAFYLDEHKKKVLLCAPVFSNPVKHQVSDLSITRISKVSGLATGGDEVFLLCSKVDKNNIEVRFSKFMSLDSNEKALWTEKADALEVHHQYAIIFKTPPYMNQSISESVNVDLYLYRAKDEECSQPVSFTYIPVDSDVEGTSRKRKKTNPFDAETNASCYLPMNPSSNALQNNFNSSFNLHQNLPTSDYCTESSSPSSSSDAVMSPSLNTDDDNSNFFRSQVFKEMIQNLDVVYSPVASDNDPELLFPTISDITTDSVEERRSPQLEAQMSKVYVGPSRLKTESSETTNQDAYPDSDSPHEDGIKDHPPIYVQGQMGLSCDYFQSALSVQPPKATKDENTFKMISDLISGGQFAQFAASFVKFGNFQNEDGNNLLHLAILSKSNKPETIYLLCYIMLSKITSLMTQKNKQKKTPLHLAVLMKHVPVIKVFLGFGADVNMRDGDGNTSIHLAVMRGAPDCLEALLSGRNVSIDAINYEGVTPLHCAILKKDERSVKLLCDKGALVYSRDGKSGKTALHLSCDAFPMILEYLANQPSADINAQDYSGNTALHLASRKGMYSAVEVLLKLGADPHISNFDADEDDSHESNPRESHGRTPAALTSDPKILELLQQYSSAAPSNNYPIVEKTRKDAGCHSKKFERATKDAGHHSKGSEREPITKLHDADECKTDSGFISGSIRHSLDGATMKKLCLMLDPPNEGWKSLILFLGMDEVDDISIAKLSKCPTEKLIEKFLASEDHELMHLKIALEFANLEKAARLVEQYCEQQT